MWELRIARPFEGYSIRKILTFVATFLVTCFAYILITAPTTHAADAEWSGGTITYQGNQYTLIDRNGPAFSESLPGITQYRYIETPTSSVANGVQKAHIIYFANGVDPPKAAAASYLVFNYVAPNTYTNETGSKTLSLTPQQKSTPATSCVVEGMGWIICPITNFLADGMDTFYKILSEFLKVQPLQTSQETAMYRAWSWMRNFANIAFVVGFLVIIYSQITSIGLTNYGIKKLLPKLIIAAILVNLSYWICAIAIDLSNITGTSLHDLFIGMRNSLVTDGNNWDLFTWKSMATLVLTGGTAAAAGGIMAYTGVAATAGAIYMLLPILLGVLLAVLVALLVLAARQAIITVMVIISPLAMVAFLLPNTEKYFEKWRGLFMTMLILFPIFSVIFGGSQLAGMAIIQSASGAGSLNLVMLGMAVQVAPIVVTPLLVRFSGSLLGRVAGMVNNPNKGLIDRTRKWSQDRAAEHKARVLANPNGQYNGRLGRGARKIDQRRRERAGWQKTHESMADNLWHGSKAYESIDEANREAERTKTIIEHHHETSWNNKVRLDASSLEKELKVRITGDEAERAKNRLATLYEESKTRQYDAAGNLKMSSEFTNAAGFNRTNMEALFNRSHDTSLNLTLEVLRKQSADRFLKSQHNTDVLQNNATQQYIGGVRGDKGASAALAYAVSEERKAYGVEMAESQQLQKHFNLSVDQRQDFVKGKAVTITDSYGNTRTFDSSDSVGREAAIELQIKEGPVKHALEIVGLSGSSLRNFRTTIQSAAAEAKLGSKTSFVGGTTMDLIATGAITSPAKFEGVIQDNIAKGKISPEVLVNIDVDAVEAYVKAAIAAKNGQTGQMDPKLRASIDAQVQAFKKHAEFTLTDDLYKGRVKDNVKVQLEDLISKI